MDKAAAVFHGQLLHLLPGLRLEAVFLQVLLRHGEHVRVDLVQQARHRALQLRQGDKLLLAGVPPGDAALSLLDVLRADLHPQRHAPHLILGKLPARGLVAVVQLHPHLERLGRLQDAALVHGNGQHHHLDGGHPGGQDQTVVVAVGHDDAADEPG